MKKETGIFALGALVALLLVGATNKAAVFDGIVESTAGGYMFPDQTIQTTAAVNGSGVRPRLFYLTDATYQGNAALTACGSGYHMASGWELKDLNSLTYASGAPGALLDGDLGEGPPTGSFRRGWFRTGQSDTAPAEPTPHCRLWTSNDPNDDGSVQSLKAPFGDSWESGGDKRCVAMHHVWCIED